MKAYSRHTATLLCQPNIDEISIKRIAWAFGCAKKDSEEESALYSLLLDKIERIRARRAEDGR